MENLYLIKVGEIILKGNNRSFFEKKLKANILHRFPPGSAKLEIKKGRFYLTSSLEVDKVNTILSTVFGIIGFAKTYVCDKNIHSIREMALTIAQQAIKQHGNTRTFKVEARRTDKSFSKTSYEIASIMGNLVQTEYNIPVDVQNPDWKIHIEIREKAFIYGALTPGLKGLPVGCAGKGLLLLSGGIDSPVAGYLMAKRGLLLEGIYFHAYPYTSEEALEKVKKLASIIARYTGGFKLTVVPFTNIQMHLKKKAEEKEITLLMRACMVAIADKIAKKRFCRCLITGESLSQVASQTLASLSYTACYSELLIFRPLIGMDKEEIISLAREKGTYETSILPYDDCCTLFSPAHPLIHPNKEELQKSFNNLEIDDLMNKAITDVDVFSY